VFQRTRSPVDRGFTLTPRISRRFLPGRLPPFLKAIVAQSIGLAGAILFVRLAAAFGDWYFPLTLIAFMQGTIAAAISRWLGMMSWWLPIQFMFVPGLLAALTLDIEPYWYLLIFMTLLGAYWSVFHSQVPLYLSSRAAWRAVADLLPDKQDLRVIDIGSGLGGLLDFLNRVRPQGRYVGIEIAPLPFALGWLRCAAKGCDMRFGSFWNHDMGGYDVVYAYLSPVPMGDLWRKLKAEMRPGSLFISNTFAVPGTVPDETVKVDDYHASPLYIYRL
jgi:SAM-dependent methyltransferase